MSFRLYLKNFQFHNALFITDDELFPTFFFLAEQPVVPLPKKERKKKTSVS